MGSHEEEICMILSRLAMAGDGIVLGLGIAGLAIRTWFKFRSYSRALKQVDETPQVEIHDLRSLVSEESSSWASSPADGSSMLVIVRGMLAPEPGSNESLSAKNAGEPAVLVERTQTYLYNEWRGLLGWSSEWRGLLGWGSLKEQVSLSRTKIPFGLLENKPHSETGPEFVHINIDNVRHPLPLITVYHHLNPIQQTSSTFLQAVFGRRYPVGLIEEEKILPLGRNITAIGLLSKTKEGNPMIKSCSSMPFFLADCSREQLVVELATGTSVLFWTGIILSSVAAGVLSYAFYKNWLKWKEWRRVKRRLAEANRREVPQPDDSQEDSSEVPDGELCVVCLLRRRRAAFVSCGHRVCCMSCAQRIEGVGNSTCPVCRQYVYGVIRIYDS